MHRNWVLILHAALNSHVATNWSIVTSRIRPVALHQDIRTALLLEQLELVGSSWGFEVSVRWLTVSDVNTLIGRSDATIRLCAIAEGGAADVASLSLSMFREYLEEVARDAKSVLGEEVLVERRYSIASSVDTILQQELSHFHPSAQVRSPQVDLLYEPANHQLSAFSPGDGPYPWGLSTLVQPLVVTTENLNWMRSCTWSELRLEAGGTLLRFIDASTLGYAEIALDENDALAAVSSHMGSPSFKRCAKFEGLIAGLRGEVDKCTGFYIAVNNNALVLRCFELSAVRHIERTEFGTVDVGMNAGLFDLRNGTQYYRPSGYATLWPKDIRQFVKQVNLADASSAAATGVPQTGTTSGESSESPSTLLTDLAFLGGVVLLLGLIWIVLRNGKRRQFNAGA